MNDPFKVPTDSIVTGYIRKASHANEGLGLRELVLAVDVPAIVKQEVERALNAQYESDDPDFDIAAYLAARFPEAAPETEVHQLHPYKPDGSVDHNVKCPGCGITHAESSPHNCFECLVALECDSMERPKRKVCTYGCFAVEGEQQIHAANNCPMHTVPTPSATAERGSVIAQSGGDCDVCNRPHVELSSVVRFADSVGHKEFYICRACLARVPAGPSAAEEAAAELNDALAGARPEAGKCACGPHGLCAWHKFEKATAAVCTACPCARCTAERKFVREMANWMLACGPMLTTDEAVAAARRVVSDA